MRILFTTFYDPQHAGTRILAAYMRQIGHTIHFLQIKLLYKYIPLEKPEYFEDGFLIYDHRLLSASAGNNPITRKELALVTRAVRKFRPDIIGFSCRSVHNHLLKDVLPVLRKGAPSACIVGGGFGPTLEPESFLAWGADLVVRGEGEETLREIAEAVRDKRSNWHTIPSLAWLENGNVVMSPLRPLETNLDRFPFPLHDEECISRIEHGKHEMGEDRPHSESPRDKSSYGVLTSRGCIGHCSYCSGGNLRELYKNEGLRSPPIRMRSLNNVLEELKQAKCRGEQSVWFLDEFLVRPVDELVDFFTRYKKEINLFFFAHLNARQLVRNEVYLNAVVDAGLVIYAFGVQSGSETFAKNILDRKNNNADFLAAIRKFNARGIGGNWHYLGGIPLESEQDFQESLGFAAQISYDPARLVINYPFSAYFRPLPKTPIVLRHPEIMPNTYDRNKWYYRALLLELRHMADDRLFASVAEDPYYREHPAALKSLNRVIMRDLHHDYLRKEIERLGDSEVYFWGCREMYRYKKYLFANTRPICILEDTETATAGFVDGIAVRHPRDVLPRYAPKPIIIFSAHAAWIYRKIRHFYPQYTDVVACAIL